MIGQIIYSMTIDLKKNIILTMIMLTDYGLILFKIHMEMKN